MTAGDKLAIFEEYEVSDFVDYIEKNNRAHGGTVSEAVDALLNEWISKLLVEDTEVARVELLNL